MTECTWDGKYLSLESTHLAKLPERVTKSLQGASNDKYLDCLAELALDPDWTGTIFARYRPLFVHFCCRWLEQLETVPSAGLQCVSALSKVLPHATHLTTFVEEIALRRKLDVFSALGRSVKATAILQLSQSSLTDILVIYLRFLQRDDERLASLISPAQLSLLLSHEALHIRYLACKALCMLLRFTEKVFSDLLAQHVGSVWLEAEWEGRTINYRLLDLWESKRVRNLQRMLQNDFDTRPFSVDMGSIRVIQPGNISPLAFDFAGYLAPTLKEVKTRSGPLVLSPTASRNLARAARGLNESQAVLVSGLVGCGKTTIIREVARTLNQSEEMLTLHLNEQTDAKLLLGFYTSSVDSGLFKWQPGVLTKAVTEGRWVLIEDLDRAPLEVVSILLPLLDRQELMVPNLGGAIRASKGFRLIATVRSYLNSNLQEMTPAANMIGNRFWSKVNFEQYAEIDLHQIIDGRFPLLRPYLPRTLAMYNALVELTRDSRFAQRSERLYGLKELLRFCCRIQNLLKDSGISGFGQAIPEALQDDIFLNAVDCFSSGMPKGDSKNKIVEIIAQELHIPKARMLFCLQTRIPDYISDQKKLKIGRVILRKKQASLFKKSHGMSSRTQPFAVTSHARQVMERIAVAVKSREPCLLVGETGVGKTTIVQELANKLDHKLIVVNLSQQSEAGDLLGGFKPVNIRSLAIPIKDDFDLLFEETFSSAKNEQYTKSISRKFMKKEWTKLLILWKEALKKIEYLYTPGSKTLDGGKPQKRRKVESAKYQKLKDRWDRLAEQIDVFEKHIRSGSRGFAFSFIEGNIVKAIRNGDWVLLDEINLASPDTLESIADLLVDGLDGSPSLLLTETGEIQRIRAHSDFRIFGAMNPATDVGKKDLPPSIRLRFTEYYFASPEEHWESLLEIVKSYMQDWVMRDTRLPQDTAQLYLEIRKLEADNRLVDGANQRPHFTIRTLARTLTYAKDIEHIYGMRRALFEGFAMSFLTALNQESISIVSPLIFQHFLSSHGNVQALLHQIPRCPGNTDQFIQFRHYWMRRGPFPISSQPYYIITPFVEANLLNLVRATSTRRYPILLQGPTSSGKTSMVEYLARLSGNKFVRINNHEHTDLQEYLGTYVSDHNGLHFEEGVLVRALREGHWLVLDELNLAPTDILEALNRLLDDNRELFVPETQEIIQPHKDFMLFATQNPPGLYGGRKVLSRALRNRFLELHFDDIPEDELETIIRERSQIAPSYCARIVAVYKKLVVLRQSNRLFEQKNSFATLRDLFRWAFRKADNVEQLAINGFMLLAERVRDPQEREDVKKIVEEVMNLKLDENELYNTNKMSQALSFESKKPQGKSIVLTKSVTRLLTLVTRALENSEPVLLVGDTGCGKTTVCQVISELFETELNILNAHQNTETGDIIGAQRPIRNKQHFEALFRKDLELAANTVPLNFLKSTADIRELFISYRDLDPTIKGKVPIEVRQRIEENGSRANALFEWSDGSLVRSMKSGHHFLLDEISLADDSVLERLNSVLESSRSIFLAEKGSLDAFVVADPKFQFLATMNPGGDYGKKELSPALRNRFTEIWVPPLSDDEDMLQIARSKLIPTLGKLADPIVSFSRWFEQRYRGTGPSTPLRQILNWIEFLNLSEESNAPFSIVHGAALVYIDGLGASPSGRISISRDAISGERQACLDVLGSFFTVDARSIYFANPKLEQTESSISFGPFSIPKKAHLSKDSKFNFDTPTTAINACRIARALQLSRPVLVEGSPGVGKSALVAALADLIGVSMTRINLSEQTDLMDLFGSDVPVEDGEVGQFQWRDAPFLQAMQRGDWILLDEMNLASQSILEGLNACLDHRGQVYIPELDQVFFRHPNFMLFAAQNPFSQGGGRKGLPGSFVNRFTVVYADDFSEADMFSISTQLFPEVPVDDIQQIIQVVSQSNTFYTGTRALTSIAEHLSLNLRDVLRWIQLLNSKESLLSAATPLDLRGPIVLNRLRSREEITIAEQLTGSSDETEVHFHRYFTNSSPFIYQCGYGSLEKREISSSISTHQAQHEPRLIESILIAIQQNLPCLLVGSPGSGKSSLLQELAAMHGARLSTVSLNADMDAIDLVGSYEQVDQQRHIAKFLKRLWEALGNYFALQILSHADLQGDFDELGPLLSTPQAQANLTTVLEAIQARAKNNPSLFDPLVRECLELLQLSSVNNRARFEWIDSPLIEAMEQGHWLILDNANLCSSSVLDRLNALLEPGGVLFINEHRSADGSPKVIIPHTTFRIFLTIDPHHGELSQAMRNRCVELYFPTIEDEDIGRVTLSNTDSTLVRLQNLERFDWKAMHDEKTNNIARVCVEHLALVDVGIAEAWQKELSRGLIDLAPDKRRLITLASQTFRCIAKSSSITSPIADLYRSMFSAMHIDFGSDHDVLSQPLNPLINSPLLSRLRKIGGLKKALWVSDMLDSQFVFAQLLDQLEILRQAKNPRWQTSTNRLERSILSTRSRTFSKDSTQFLAQFFQEILDSIVSWTGYMLSSDPDPGEYPRALVDYIVDLFDMSQAEPFDESKFQAYLEDGKALARSFQQNPTNAEIARSLKSSLSRFDANWALVTGLSMRDLWLTFRPIMPIYSTTRKQALDLEVIADRFDEASWGSDSSLKTIISLRASFRSILHQLNNAQGFGGDKSPSEAGVYQNESQTMLRIVTDETKELQLIRSQARPYFQNESECLRQYVSCHEACLLEDRQIILDMLSGRKTKDSARPFNSPTSDYLLHVLQDCTGIDSEDCQLYALKGNLPLSISRRLLHVFEVPLKDLSRLSEEILIFNKQIAVSTEAINADQHAVLQTLLSTLLCHALKANHKFLKSSLLAQWMRFLQDPKNAPMPTIPLTSYSQESSEREPSSSQSIHYILSQYFYPALSYFQAVDNNISGQIPSTGRAWISVFLGLLKLYVPNAPFDPAIKPLVEAERWLKRKRRLEIQLQALETFEQHISGERTSLQCEVVRQRIQNMPEKPSVATPARPSPSMIADIQGEFNRVIQTIIRPCDQLLSGSNQSHLEAKIIHSNLRRMISRLTNIYREYDDLIKPLNGFLQGLAIGLTLWFANPSSLSNTSTVERPSSIHLSILGLNLQQTFESLPAQDTTQDLSYLDRRTIILEYLILEKNIEGHITNECSARASEIFHSMFEDWKARLRFDQAQEANKSSLYRYRGESKDLGTQKRELNDLFPNSIEYQDSNCLESGQTKRPQAITQIIAALHWRLFSKNVHKNYAVPCFAREIVTRLSHLPDEQAKFHPKHVTNLMPSVIFIMGEASDSLSTHQNKNVNPSFYRDINVPQIQRLTGFLLRLRDRVREVHELWPEHATLGELLRIINELFDVKYSEPLAKIIPKVEMLHCFIHEWQQVTSREFSMYTLYDELTALIIDWRRLELSTWARLLDFEDENHAREAESWWFIAYDAIFSSLWKSATSEMDAQYDLEALVAELQRFISTAPIGQFARRIQMLETFEQHTRCLKSITPEFSRVSDALANVVRYFSRWSQQVETSIKSCRDERDKEMKEAFLLASWKDRNILALRESARKSHYTLLKVVRKYRKVLDQSFETILQEPATIHTLGAGLVTKVFTHTPPLLDRSALEICRRSFPTWSDRTSSLHDPENIVAKMSELATIPTSELDSRLYIHSFQVSLLQMIEVLKKETPQKATAENKALAKHLKARKRNLFSDTMKEIGQMGIRSNLDLKALSTQDSIGKILCCVPTTTELRCSEHYFFTFVDQLSLARQASRQHSQDLASSEVSRSIKLLEGLLHHLILQRKSLGESLAELTVFDKTSESLSLLWEPSEYEIKHQVNHLSGPDHYTRRLSWLQGVLDGTCSVVERLESMGGCDFSLLREGLRERICRGANLQKLLERLPATVDGLTTSTHAITLSEIDQFLATIREDIDRWYFEFPGAKFVLQHLQPWLDTRIDLNQLESLVGTSRLPGLENFGKEKSKTDSAEYLDEIQVFKLVDSMRVGIQNLKGEFGDLPGSCEEKNWLVREERALSMATQRLHLREVAARLQDILLKRLQHCKPAKLRAACALTAAISPILQQYRNSFSGIIQKRLEVHESLCELAVHLSKSFNNIVTQGFCSPQESSDEQAGSGQVEEGVGLGDGDVEGAEDISKEIDKDEDVSELAQESRREQNENAENAISEDNAINVGDTELEDRMSDAADSVVEHDEDEQDPGSEDDMSDEVGEVDDLDPSAVDEKIWNGSSKNEERERRNDKVNGERNNELSTQNQQNDDTVEDMLEGTDELSDENKDEELPSGGPEPAEIEAEKGENLELPDDIMGDDSKSPDDLTEDEGMKDMSDVETRSNDGQASVGDEENDLKFYDVNEDVGESDDADTNEENHNIEARNEHSNAEPRETDDADNKFLHQDANTDISSPADMQMDESRGSGVQQQKKDHHDNSEQDEFHASETATRNEAAEIAFGGHDEAEEGHIDATHNSRDSPKQEQNSTLDSKKEPFRKLGEALERLHRASLAVHKPKEPQAVQEGQDEKILPSNRFQHLENDTDNADMQVLDEAAGEEPTALGELDLEIEKSQELSKLAERSPNILDSEDMFMEEAEQSTDDQADSAQATFFESRDESKTTDNQTRSEKEVNDVSDDNPTDEIDIELSEVRLEPEERNERPIEEARHLWSQFEKTTHSLSILLTEQLRLILAPSQATKMRGDFRTGKRLNIKRIIPYIASQYKRDKIWMRRSIPSKRNYQVMIAVDDSKSMEESGSGKLAFESLALLSQSLSMLEVGQICIASFGENFRVAHAFEQTFSTESAISILKHFTFQQRKTNIQNLLLASLDVFRQARIKQSSSGTDLWQLQLIISDGVCEEHESIRRLVRQAHEERIMVVFAVVNSSSGHSILDMTQASFEPDENGETKLKVKRYLDGFPFIYYLIVRDVQSLPNALSAALRQWFAEVSSVG